MATRLRETDANHSGKRRKPRKGTHSCWACKRRKEKCTFVSLNGVDPAMSCLGCRRRGTRCVSQEFPEEHLVSLLPPDHGRQMRERVTRVEAMVEQLSNQQGRVPNLLTPVSSHDGGVSSPQTCSFDASAVKHPASRLTSPDHTSSTQSAFTYTAEPYILRPPADNRLAEVLYDALPPREDVEAIYGANKHRVDVFNESLTVPYTVLETHGSNCSRNPLLSLSADTHPVLIARQLLQLATLLQQTPPEQTWSPSEPMDVMKQRLADTAIRLVTTQERLLGSVEGLECVILESFFRVNSGEMRLSLMAIRRAMALAQMMGFHRPGARLQPPLLHLETTADPQFMWFRIVSFDRFLCLILGMPQGSLDRGIVSEDRIQNDTPLGRLERFQSAIASQILERNENDPYDFSITEELDRELQKAATNVPSKWWLPPDLVESSKDQHTLFWDVRRLSVQMMHYNLVNQLHVPYMLLSSTGSRYEYSKCACVNASREMLLRFVSLRRINRVADSCRTSDFLALMAAITLVLAHLDSHRRPSVADSLLSHLYLGDRAMMEQAQENMQEVSKQSADALTAQSADLLGRLLSIEAEAAEGHKARAESVSVQTPINFRSNPDSHTGVRVHIPYFGVIKLRENRSKDDPSIPAEIEEQQTTPLVLQTLDTGRPDQTTEVAPYDPLVPGLMDRAEDWSFQGIDMAFFDSLMQAGELDPGLGGRDDVTGLQ